MYLSLLFRFATASAFCAALLLAQSVDPILVQGTVYDQSTGLPIAGAEILRGTSPILTTGANGGFAIPASIWGSATQAGLYFRASGYWVHGQAIVITSTPTFVTVNLIPGGTLVEGTIRDSVTGSPIAGATVRANRVTYISGTSTTTNAEGKYSFPASAFLDNLAGGPLELTASAQNYLFQNLTTLPFVAPFPVVVDGNIVPDSNPTVSVQGTITDRATAQPIAGVRILRGTSVIAITDNAGTFTLTAGQLGTSNSISFVLQAVGYWAGVLSVNLTAGPVQAASSLLPGGIIIQGRVTDSNSGSPVVGTNVNVSGGQRFTALAYATDSLGDYQVDSSNWFEASSAGFNAGISINAAGFYQYVRTAQVSSSIPLISNVALVPITGGTISGVVVDRLTNQPLAGVSVGSAPNSPFTTTAANGTFSFSQAEFGSSQTRNVWFKRLGYWSQGLSVTITGPNTVFNVSMLPGGTVIQGAVTELGTGVPVANVSVALPGGADAGTRRTITDINGRYAIDSSEWQEVSAGGFSRNLEVLASGGGYFSPVFVSTSVGPSYPTILDVQLTPTGLKSGVTITTSPSGLPITVDGVTANSPRSFAWSANSVHIINAPLTTPIATGSRYSFADWSDGGSASHAFVTSTATTTVTASFITQHLLTTSASPAAGGSVTAGGWFNVGQSVGLTAVPAAGYTFSQFAGDITSNTNPHTLVMDSPKNVIAQFTPPFVTTPTPTGTNVQVTSSFTNGAVVTTYNSVTSPGNTVVTPISPTTVGTAPNGFAIQGSGYEAAYEITTTAAYSGTILTCFTATPVTDPAVFSELRILHSELVSESYQLIDRTVLAGANQPDFPTRRICAETSSLSPFVFARVLDKLPPSLADLVTSSTTVAIGTAFTLTLSANDATTGASKISLLEYSSDGGTTWQKASANYYSSQSIQVTVPQNLPVGVWSFCGRATDGARNVASKCGAIVAVYDPSGGFVTGGGQVASPAGADLANPSAAGQATFGFVSKYLPGRNTPTGNLEFQFKEGSLNFKSTSMDWLVVTGEPRAMFRGIGTVNGTGECKFEVDAWDGSFSGNVDGFGLKIFSCAGGGDRYTLPARPLTRGSIIIHK